MAVDHLSSINDANKTGGAKGYLGKPITETITNGFFTVDEKWAVQYWNKAAEILLGVKAKDILGKNLWEKFAGIIPLEFYMVYQKAFLDDVPLHFEEYWGEMGAWFDVITYHCDNTLSVSFKSSNHPHTEHPEHPVERLKVLTELYKLVTEVTNDCLWEWDLQAKEIFWIDGGHKRTFGYQVENALIPQSFWESRLHPDDKVRILTKLIKAITDGITCVWEDEYRFEKANGEYAHVHDRGHIVYNEDKMATRMIGATQDITARKLIENKLLQTERKLSLLVRQSVNALIITDFEAKVTWVNNAFTAMSGYKLEEVIGRELGSILLENATDPATVEFIQRKMKDRQSFDCELINYSKSGKSYWARVQGQPLLDENENFERYFVIESNITEKVLLGNKLAQEKIEKQKVATLAMIAAQENKMAAIGEELQENLSQALAVSKMYIEMSRTDEAHSNDLLTKASTYILNVIEGLRKVSNPLLTPNSHALGLFDSIKNLLSDVNKISLLKIQFNTIRITEQDMDNQFQLNIFRIIQEQLNNIVQHAEASQGSINMTKKGDEIILLIMDNGQGCDLLTNKERTGIVNIRTRATLYDGKVEIVSKPGKGYELKVILPLNAVTK